MVYTSGGKYQAINLYPGEYELTVGRRGFTSDPQKVTIKAGATSKADVVLKDADLTPKPGVNGPSTVVAYPGRATITEKDVEFHTDYDKVHPPAPGREVLERVCMSCHGVNFYSLKTLGPRDLGRRHQHHEQAHQRRRRGGAARQDDAEGPAASARLSRDLHGPERQEARAHDRVRHAARRGGARQGHVRRIRDAEARRQHPSGRAEPVFRSGRQRLDDRSRDQERHHQARSAHRDVGDLPAARARHPARHHGRFQGHRLVGRDRRLEVRPARSEDRQDGPLSRSIRPACSRRAATIRSSMPRTTSG